VSEPARKPLAMIAAMAKNRVIGREGGIPWRHPEDQRRFKRITMGHALIMGRATYDSIGRPLPGRRTIVVSRNPALRIEGCEVAPDLDTAIALARGTDAEPFIAGGAQIYAEALPHATTLHLTLLDDSHPGDTYFPVLDDTEWAETERSREPGLTYLTLVRRG
jgi:dihydrofolate reductase